MIHILPTVPPAINGLGDYCRQLWRHWPSPRPAWSCVAAQVPPGAREAWPECSVLGFDPTPASLQSALDNALRNERAHSEPGDAQRQAPVVVLHYVGFAYHPRGAPTWLPGALSKWKKRNEGRLVVMFHELYFEGNRPLSSAFWLRPIARRIMRQLEGLADTWVTSCPSYAARLLEETQQRGALQSSASGEWPLGKGAIIPVGPNITPVGEADFHRPWPLAQGGRLRVVVFGLPNTRLWTLQHSEPLLRLLADEGMVESILLLGQSSSGGISAQTEAIQARIGHADLWQSRCDLSPGELSLTLASQHLGLVYNHSGILTKSTVYASLCAHAIVPVVGSASGSPAQAEQAQQRWLKSMSLPYLLHERASPEVAVAQLRDADAMARLQGQIERAANGALQWSSITQSWARVVERAQGLAPHPEVQAQ